MQRKGILELYEKWSVSHVELSAAVIVGWAAPLSSLVKNRPEALLHSMASTPEPSETITPPCRDLFLSIFSSKIVFPYICPLSIRNHVLSGDKRVVDERDMNLANGCKSRAPQPERNFLSQWLFRVLHIQVHKDLVENHFTRCIAS